MCALSLFLTIHCPLHWPFTLTLSPPHLLHSTFSSAAAGLVSATAALAPGWAAREPVEYRAYYYALRYVPHDGTILLLRSQVCTAYGTVLLNLLDTRSNAHKYEGFFIHWPMPNVWCHFEFHPQIQNSYPIPFPLHTFPSFSSVATETHDWEVVRWATAKVDALAQQVGGGGEVWLGRPEVEGGRTGHDA